MTSDASAAPQRGHRRWWGLVTVLAFAAAFALLLFAGRGMWFFTDEWNFLLTRRDPSVDALMRPHNEHWVALHVLIYQGLVAAFGVVSYWPFYVTACVLQLAATVAGWVLLRRLGVPRVPALLAALGLLLMGAASEQLFNAFQMGWTAPIALSLTAVAVLDRERGGWRDSALSAACIALAMPFGGVALAFVLGIGAALVVRGEFRRALVVGGPGLVLYAAWRAVWGISPPLEIEAFRLLPTYVVYGLAASLRGYTGLPIRVAAAVAVLIVLAAGVLALTRRLPLAGSAALLTLLAFFASAGVARVVAFGRVQAGSSRYLYIGALLLLLALAAVTTPLWRGAARTPATVVASAVLATCLAVNVLSLREGRREVLVLKGNSAVRIEAADALLADGLPHVPVAQPDPDFAPDVTAEELAELREDGLDLDYAGPVVLTDPVVETERLRLQVAFTPVPDVTADVRLVSGRATLTPRSEGCADLDVPPGAILEFASSPGRLRLEPGTESVLQVRRAGTPLDIFFEKRLEPGQVHQLELALPAAEETGGLLSLGFPVGAELGLCARELSDARGA